MISQWLSRLLGDSSDKASERLETVASCVDGDLSHVELQEHRTVCAFAGGRLVNFFREQPPHTRPADEVWWLVPADDLVVVSHLLVGSRTVEVESKIRFEPESELLNLLDGREQLTRDDVASLVTSQLGGLVDSLELNDGDKLRELDDFERERLRAKLSLLLQNRGLRCTELRKFAIVHEQEPAVPTAEERAAGEPEGGTAAKPDQGDELVWAEIVEEVNTTEDWERVMASVESAGVAVDETTAAQLDELGEAIVNRRVEAREVAARLKQIAEEARGRAGISQPDLRRLRGLDLRLDWAEPRDDASENRAGAPEVMVKRLPWTWWILNRKRVDERLLGFLNHAVREMKAGFDAYRSSHKFGPELVKLRRINERLEMAIDLLDTVPTLTPPRSELRPERTKIKELVQSVERAVTPTETALAEIRELRKAAPGSDQWSASCDEICAALDQLAEQLRQRRNVR